METHTLGCVWQQMTISLFALLSGHVLGQQTRGYLFTEPDYKTTHTQECPKVPFPSMRVATHGNCYTIQNIALNRHNFLNFHPIFIIRSPYCLASKDGKNGTKQPVKIFSLLLL